MSQKQISLSVDLQKLQDQGYDVEIRSGHVIINSIPYVNSKGEIALGALVSPLDLAGEVTKAPQDHKAWFIGDHPCTKNGIPIEGIKHSSQDQKLADDIEVNHMFSNKPQGGYPDYFEKMTSYTQIIFHHARSVDSTVEVQLYKPIVTSEDDSVFNYTDSASTRAGIANLNAKLAMNKVAIIGLGGTGAYILDLLAKTHVREIHLFDGDEFLQHNAFRSPGAASLEELQGRPLKVDYLANLYKKMRRGIVPNGFYITDENVDMISNFDFIFVCVDKAAVRKLISSTLNPTNVPFIDVGMEVQLLEDSKQLLGCCRVTLSTPQKRDHYDKCVPLHEDDEDHIYKSNIQLADLNNLNAMLAVIRWKKYCDFYQDLIMEHDSVYATNSHQLTKDEQL